MHLWDLDLPHVTIKLKSVLREFTLTDHPTPDTPNCVFDSYTYTPQSGLTRFSRHIKDSRNAWNGTAILRDDGAPIGTGEDPRAFLWRSSPCISAACFSPQHGFINQIYIQSQDRWLTLITPSGVTRGKNWTPFVRDDELYFIHGFSPFRVFKARQNHPNDGFLLLDIVAQHDIATAKSFDGFSRLRGGSNGLQIGNWIIGAGHTSGRLQKNIGTSMIHRPFIFAYHPDHSLTYFDCPFEFPETYKIVDPTSLFLRDGKLQLVTCETQQVWDHAPQQGRICLYEMELPKDENENSFGFGGRRLHRWPDGQTSKVRRLLGSWRRHQAA